MDPRIVMMAVMNGDVTQLVMYITFNVSMADNLILDFYLRNRKGISCFSIIVFILQTNQVITAGISSWDLLSNMIPTVIF